ncbi:MAG: TadE family protein [Pirellulaceae bacterium]
MSRQNRDRRHGATLLEFILVLPILLIAVLAIVEFGQLFANLQQLELATRAGALESVETNLPPSGPIPPEVLEVITESLRASKILGTSESIENVGGVRIQHSYDNNPNSNPAPPYTLTAGTPDTTVTITMANEPYVHITVSLPTTRLAPNVLRQLGIDLQDRVSSQSKLLRHEF